MNVSRKNILIGMNKKYFHKATIPDMFKLNYMVAEIFHENKP